MRPLKVVVVVLRWFAIDSNTAWASITHSPTQRTLGTLASEAQAHHIAFYDSTPSGRCLGARCTAGDNDPDRLALQMRAGTEVIGLAIDPSGTQCAHLRNSPFASLLAPFA